MRKIASLVVCGSLFVACADGASPPDPSAPAPSAPGAVPPLTGRIASTDARANAPTLLWVDREDTPAPGRPATAADAARWHLGRLAQYYRLSDDQVAGLDVVEVHDTGRGAIIVRFSRQIDGVEVLGERVSVAMTRTLDVVALTGYVTGDTPGVAKAPRRARAAFSVDESHAIAAAMSDLSGVHLDATDFTAPFDMPGGYRALQLQPAGAVRVQAGTAEPSRAKPIFFRQGPGALVPAFYVEADIGSDPQKTPRNFSYVIAGDDARVLAKHDLTEYDHAVTYRVYADNSGLFTPWDGPQGTSVTPHPTAIPDGFQPTFQPAQLVTLSSLSAVGVNDPWLPDGASETLGNNVDAYVDLVAPDGFTPGSADFRGVTTSADTFDYAFDLEQSADASVSQRQAALTQLFFNDNWFHDWYYAAGFTEAAGNAQFSNYGRGGVEGDGLRAEAQDFSGFNNANMSTPADGGRPRMQMFLWTKPTQLAVTITDPPDLAGTFTNINTANFGPLNFSLSGAIVRANPFDACGPLVGDFTGKIVFVDRGGATCPNGFAGKAQTVQAAGGIGIIIANVATSGNPTIPPLMGGTPTGPVTIGVVSMNFADGERFRAEFVAGIPVSGSVVRAVKLLDGDIDNQIVAHEWGHYISNRLVFNAAGLDTNMARGLGEGWADFHAMLITVREEDTLNPTNANWNGTYGVGDFATSSDPNSYYFGIRRYPYSTDMTKNPMTFKHISDANPLPTNPAPHFDGAHSEVHNTGEVWTTMLWECYAALLRDTLGATPRLTFAQARDRMRDYIVAAYKLTPASPTLLEARDAILLAALINDTADYNAIGNAFAKRGAGVNAIAPPRGENLNTPVVESFVFGPSLQQRGATLTDDVTALCTSDNILDDGETGTLTVTFANVGTSDTPALTATVSSTTTGIGFPDGTTITVPAIPRAGTGKATIHVAASGIASNTPIVITVQTPDAGAGEAAPVNYSFAGSADEIAGTSNTDDAERSFSTWLKTSSVPNPTPDMVWHTVATSPTNHAYTARSPGFAATSELVSPLIAVPAGGALTMSFDHRFSFERDATNNLNFDAGVLEFSTDNGVTWTDVFTLAGNGLAYNGIVASGNPIATRPAFTGDSPLYPAFRTQNVNLGTSFGGKAVRLRFRASGDSGVSSPGWDVDNITITGGITPPFLGLVAQSPTCNRQPIANAGANQTVSEFTPGPVFGPVTVTLDGSASIDPDGGTLSYQWTQIAGPTAAITNATARFPTFVVPQVPRTPSPTSLIFQLVVNDGTVASAAKQTIVNVNNVNRPPVANAGSAQTVPSGTLVTLDGSASTDPDVGDPALTFAWVAPAGITLSDATAAKPTFTAPDVAVSTPLDFALTVSDGLATSTAHVIITVTHVNHPPVASAGPAQSVTSGTTVTLDASGSSDPDGDVLTFVWTPPAGITLSDPTAVHPTFVAPAATTILTFTLVVTDTSNATSTATVDISVFNVINHPPVAHAGPDVTATSGQTVTLHGSGSDPDGDPITFQWHAPSGITLIGGNTSTPHFVAPTVQSTKKFTITLTVTDSRGARSTDAMDLTVKKRHL